MLPGITPPVLDGPRRNGTKSPRAAVLLAVLACFTLLAACSGVESQLEEIRSLQEAGQFDPSIAPLRRILAEDSNHPEANYRLGIALRQTGRASLAVWPLQKASESDEYAIQAGLMLASTLAANAAHEEAIKAATRVLTLEPANVVALHTRGQAYLTVGQPDLALADAEAILEISREDHRAALLRGSALIDLDRAEEAESAFQALADQADKSGNANDAARKCAALATFYRSQKQNDRARETFEKCIEKYPTHALLQQWVADFYVEIGEPDEAILVWRTAVKATPEDLGLRAKLADLLYGQGQIDEAQATLAEAVELFDTPEAWRMLASFHRKTSNPKSARESLEQAMDRTRNVSGPMRFALADMLIEEGDYARAESIAESLEEPAYKQLLKGAIQLKKGDAKAALESFDAGLRLWPNNAGARYLAGRAAQELGDRERALAEYREAVRVGETETDAALRLAQLHFAEGEFVLAGQFAQRHITKRPYVDPAAHVIAARSATAVGALDKAEVILNDLRVKDGSNPTAYVEFAAVKRRTDGSKAALEVIQTSGLDLTDPANADAVSAAASDLIAVGDTAGALKIVQAAVAAHPESAVFLDLKGRVLVRTGRQADASKAFAAALAADPSFAPALEGSGNIERASGDLDGAIAWFERAATADPDNGNYVYLQAQTYMMKGDEATATTLLEKSLELDPSHVGANNDMAWLLASSGKDLDRALDLAKRAVRVERSADTLDTLGYVHLKKGDMAEAVSVLGKALEARPDSQSIEYRLGIALAGKGDKEEARAVLTKALTGPAFPEAADARAELDKLQDS
jgi:tetratricopeptide (TPR) repeat protein